MVTFLLAAAAAASTTVWLLKWRTPADDLGRTVLLVPATPAVDAQRMALILGSSPAQSDAAPPDASLSASNRFTLLGVVADRQHGGYALISIDGKPAKSYRVGEPVESALLLQSVTPRSAALAAQRDAPASVTLELPKLTQP